MKPRGILLMVLIALVVVLRVSAAQTEPSSGDSSWRDEFLAEAVAVYEAHARTRADTVPAPTESFLVREPRPEEVPDVIFWRSAGNLSSSFDVREVARAIERQSAQRETGKLESILSPQTLYEHRFRKVHVGIYSVLGIPVLVAVSW